MRTATFYAKSSFSLLALPARTWTALSRMLSTVPPFGFGMVLAFAGALFGGLVVIAQSGAEWRWAKIRPPRDLWAVVFIPTHGLSTKFARSLIPTEIPRSDAVFNLARTGLLVHAFHARDYSLLRMAMQDRLHQPYREPVIPGLRAMIDAAEKAGAVGAALSGAGPGVLALANGKVAKIARAMKQAAQRAKIMGVVRILALSAQGAL